VGTHVLKTTHELNYHKNVGTHVLNKTHEHLPVSCSVWTRGIQTEVTSKDVCHPQCVPCILIEEVCSVTNEGHNRARCSIVEVEPDLSYQEHASKILDFKERSTRARMVKMYKIQWRNHTEEEATWETEDFLRKNYPDCLPREIGT
jgi:hypothetical protein